MYLLDFCILLDYIATLIILKLTLTYHSQISVLCEIWGLWNTQVTCLLCSTCPSTTKNRNSSARSSVLILSTRFPTSAVDMGCCCYLSGALPVCWGLTCLDQRQVSNPTSFSFVNMLTSQYKFNGIVSEPVIKWMSVFFGAPSHSQIALRTFYHRT